jgi:hypothetical protein
MLCIIEKKHLLLRTIQNTTTFYHIHQHQHQHHHHHAHCHHHLPVSLSSRSCNKRHQSPPPCKLYHLQPHKNNTHLSLLTTSSMTFNRKIWTGKPCHINSFETPFNHQNPTMNYLNYQKCFYSSTISTESDIDNNNNNIDEMNQARELLKEFKLFIRHSLVYKSDIPPKDLNISDPPSLLVNPNTPSPYPPPHEANLFEKYSQAWKILSKLISVLQKLTSSKTKADTSKVQFSMNDITWATRIYAYLLDPPVSAVSSSTPSFPDESASELFQFLHTYAKINPLLIPYHIGTNFFKVTKRHTK